MQPAAGLKVKASAQQHGTIDASATSGPMYADPPVHQDHHPLLRHWQLVLMYFRY